MSGTPTPNPLGLSDEDFLNQNGPAEEQGQTDGETLTDPNLTQENQEDGADASNSEDPNKAAQEAAKPGASGEEVKEPASDPESTPAADGAPVDEGASGAASEPAKQPGVEGEPPASGSNSEGSQASETDKTPDYKAVYDLIMSPFKANNKEIQLKDPAEAIQLMQMGANYTRKLQEMAPQRKILTMLGNHGLLDENKLSFFIALDKKDPEAIKKLIMESGIDPLDIDTKIEPAYQEGSYQVSDQEVTFRTHLDELTSTDSGKQTLKTINDDWDQASKDLLWQQPEVFSIIQDHRETGIYSKITNEMDRQRTLGTLLPTTPFLEAYKTIGDELHTAGAFNPENPVDGADPVGTVDNPAASAAKPAAVIAEARPAAPKPTVDNGDKAGAASPSRNAPGKGKETTNFLAMSDDDFLKANNLDGRV